MRYLWIIPAVLFSVFLSMMIFSFCRCFVRGKDRPLDEIPLEGTHYERYKEALLNYIKEIKTEPNTLEEIRSRDGITLRGRYYDFGSRKTVIMVHGYRALPYNNVHASFRVFRNLGYNILLVSQRAHGESDGRCITFGGREQYDVLDWVELADRKYRPERLVLYGVSMGGAAIAYASDKFTGRIPDALVLDCGFLNSYDIVRRNVKNLGWLGKFMLDLARFQGILFLRCDIRKPDTTEAISRSRIPVFFIQGTEDETVFPEESQKNFEASPAAIKQISYIDHAGHVEAFLEAPARLEQELKQFLEKTEKES